jgi:hypothetical protein
MNATHIIRYLTCGGLVWNCISSGKDLENKQEGTLVCSIKKSWYYRVSVCMDDVMVEKSFEDAVCFE